MLEQRCIVFASSLPASILLSDNTSFWPREFTSKVLRFTLLLLFLLLFLDNYSVFIYSHWIIMNIFWDKLCILGHSRLPPLCQPSIIGDLTQQTDPMQTAWNFHWIETKEECARTAVWNNSSLQKVCLGVTKACTWPWNVELLVAISFKQSRPANS